jgi:uncharacterized membrane protein YbaN (DUF454 family)
MLPVLPTTPFLLLASYVCIRSSPALDNYLRRSPVFGPFLRDWQQHHGVRLHVKIVAITVLAAVVGASVFFGRLPLPLLALLCLLALVGLVVILRLPLVRDEEPPAAESGKPPPQDVAHRVEANASPQNVGTRE